MPIFDCHNNLYTAFIQYVLNKTDKVLLSKCEKSAKKLFILQFKSLTAFRGNTFLLVGHNSLPIGDYICQRIVCFVHIA